jgi:hypothetical protein
VHEPLCRSSQNLEDHRAKYLLSSVNDRGQRCWFYRVAITGLHTRIFGPFTRKSDAIAGFELFINGALEALCACLNDATAGENQVLQFIQPPHYLDEGIRTQENSYPLDGEGGRRLWRKP